MQGLPLLMTDMRGSLGGLTASKNRWGSYFRSRVTPIQPNTVAQLGAKTSFSASASIWRSLSQERKQQFNAFAKSSFQPRNKANKGRYTGQLAFSALYTQFINSIRINRTFELEKNDVLIPGGITTYAFNGPQTDGLGGLQNPDMTDTNGNERIMSLVDVSILWDGSFSFKILVGNGSGYDFVGFYNLEAIRFGFAVYCSSANPAQGMNYRNKEKYLLGYLNSPEFVIPSDGENAITFTFATTDVLPTVNYQSFPVGNDWVNLSVYMVSNTNQMKLIGRAETQVLAI